jgi:hypothetical protein
MTVGIAFTNGLEAIAVTDSRVSGSGRQSDSVNKMGDFSGGKYSGVIFGTGSANLIEGVIRNLKSHSANPNLDAFVAAVHKNYKEKVDCFDNSYLDSMKIETEKKAKVIEGKEEKKQFSEQKLRELIRDYENKKHDLENMTHFALVGYDDVKEKIRAFRLDPFLNIEINNNHVEIGSGGDGANMYLSTKLQGVDSNQLTPADLAFFALNAYSTATVNQGVGGTPKIARISKEGCRIIPIEKTIALANLSGAYLSEFPGSAFNKEITRETFKLILDNKADYGKIAAELGLSENALKTNYIPYSSWQERANRKLFNCHKD